MADVFISYASPDRERARLLADGLEQQGLSVWWDREIQPGRPFDDAIEEALNSALCVIVLWSHASVKSDWVKAEAGEAAEKRVLVPALIDRTRIPLRFRQFQAADLTAWNGATNDPEFCKLLVSVGRLLGRPVRVAGQPLQMPPETGSQTRSAARWRLAVPALAILAVAAVILASMWSTQVDVPSVVGQPLNQAMGSIAAAKLITGNVTHEPSAESALGTVLRQEPAPGATAARGTAVALVVAVAPPPSPSRSAAATDQKSDPASILADPAGGFGMGIMFEVADLGLQVMFAGDESSVAALLSGAKGPGAVVMRVSTGPAQKAGIRAGDVITKIAGAPIAAENDLRVALRKIGPGITSFTIRRGEAELTLKVDCPPCKPS
ncbi:MAG TPA: TIR domain-containing protein [Vicinamibacterales bacterium]|nr:TIR domain-containing protein [Vicinamibacterales bacterium]